MKILLVTLIIVAVNIYVTDGFPQTQRDGADREMELRAMYTAPDGEGEVSQLSIK